MMLREMGDPDDDVIIPKKIEKEIVQKKAEKKR